MALRTQSQNHTLLYDKNSRKPEEARTQATQHHQRELMGFFFPQNGFFRFDNSY